VIVVTEKTMSRIPEGLQKSVELLKSLEPHIPLAPAPGKNAVIAKRDLPQHVPQQCVPQQPVFDKPQSQLTISVIYTSVNATLAALRKAAELADSLGAHIILVAPQVVPYPLPLEQPPVRRDWNAKHFCTMAAQCPVETTVHFYLCRDFSETLLNVLKPSALVVIGSGKRWRWPTFCLPTLYWPTKEERLAKKLTKAGHEVILAETE
jgi:hypothetical protein